MLNLNNVEKMRLISDPLFSFVRPKQGLTVGTPAALAHKELHNALFSNCRLSKRSASIRFITTDIRPQVACNISP